jgi:hypothetical protein
MHQYPKFKFKPAKNANAFEAVLVKSQAEESALLGEHHDSPSAFGVETHPNPSEVALKEAAKEAKKPAKGKGAA